MEQNPTIINSMGLFSLKRPLSSGFLPLVGGGVFAFGYPSTFAPHTFYFPIFGLFLFFQALPIHNEDSGDGWRLLWKKWKGSLLALLCFSLGSYGVGYYWIPYVLKEFGEIAFPFNHILGVLFSLVAFPQYLLFIFILPLGGKMTKLSTKNIFLAFLLTVLEQYTPQQFPVHPGHAWLSLAPGLGLAPFFGVPLFSFVSSWMALVLLGKLRTRKWDWPGITFFILFWAINKAMPLPPPLKDGTLTTIRMVQANIENFIKLSGKAGEEKAFQETVDRYLHSSIQNPGPVDLILWPETAYPDSLNSALMKSEPRSIPEAFRQTLSTSKAQLITGGYDQSSNDNLHFYETEHNALFFFNREGLLNDVYHKRRLMPFGENLPFGPFNFFLAKIITNVSFLAQGERLPLFELDNKATLINAICYEILFSDDIRNYLNHTRKTYRRETHFILNVANDSWYGESAEPYQHQFLSHWRSLEFQIPIVRMTNTGLSSILYPDGSRSRDMGLFQMAVQDYRLFTQAKAPTFFQKYGPLPTFALILFLFILATLLQLCWRKKGN